MFNSTFILLLHLYGFSKILAPIVADLKQLEHGVNFTLCDGAVVHKRATVVQTVGDNLALHKLCGFVESFSAKHFCRFCMINKADCDTTYTDDGLELRIIDRLFDVLNSRNPIAKGFKAPLKLSNYMFWRPFLDEARDYLVGLSDPHGTPM